MLNINNGDQYHRQKIDDLLEKLSVQVLNDTILLICLNETQDIRELNENYEKILKENEQLYQSIYKLDQYLSFILSSISCILMPILFFSYLKLKKESFKILFKENHLIYILLISLFLAHFITIVDVISNKYIHTSIVCLIFALIKQYIWLTTIFQMNTYAIDLYFKIVQPFSSFSKKPPYHFYFCHFLSIPFILTALPLILHVNNKSNIYSFHHCFLTGTNYLLTCFFLPICLICFINLILVLVYYNRLKKTTSVKSRTMSEEKRNSQLLNTFIKLCFLLGVSWLIYLVVAILNLFIKAKYFKLILIIPTVQICLQGAFVAMVHFMPVIYEHTITNKIFKNKDEYVNKTDDSDRKLLPRSNVTTKTSIPSLQ